MKPAGIADRLATYLLRLRIPSRTEFFEHPLWRAPTTPAADLQDTVEVIVRVPCAAQITVAGLDKRLSQLAQPPADVSRSRLDADETESVKAREHAVDLAPIDVNRAEVLPVLSPRTR